MSSTSDIKSKAKSNNNWYQLAKHSVFLSEGTGDLSLITSDLPFEKLENLKLFIGRRLDKKAISIGTGNYSLMEFSSDDNSKYPATCFYISLYCWDKAAILSYCLIAPPESHLELFQNDLSIFSRSHVQQITERIDIKQIHTFPQTELATYLNEWPKHSIDYLSRCCLYATNNISYIIQAAFTPYTFQFDENIPKGLQNDLIRFRDSINMAETFNIINSKNIPVININQACYSEDLTPSAFCEEWAKMLVKSTMSVVSIKRTLDNMIQKTINDFNTLRRILTQANTDHNSLYIACSFLRSSGNAAIFLQYAKLDTELSEEVIDILEKYLIETGDI